MHQVVFMDNVTVVLSVLYKDNLNYNDSEGIYSIKNLDWSKSIYSSEVVKLNQIINSQPKSFYSEV